MVGYLGFSCEGYRHEVGTGPALEFRGTGRSQLFGAAQAPPTQENQLGSPNFVLCAKVPYWPAEGAATPCSLFPSKEASCQSHRNNLWSVQQLPSFSKKQSRLPDPGIHQLVGTRDMSRGPLSLLSSYQQIISSLTTVPYWKPRQNSLHPPSIAAALSCI